MEKIIKLITVLLVFNSFTYCKKEEAKGKEEGEKINLSEQRVEASLPDFSVEVVLTEAAKKKLTKGKESIIVSYEFGNTIDPDSEMVSDTEELLDSYISHTKSLKLGPEKFKTFQPDYEALVNVYSGRKSSDMNLLSCGIVQDQITKLRGKVHKINCDLIGK